MLKSAPQYNIWELGLPMRGLTEAIIVVIKMSSKLQKDAILSVVYFSMEKMLLYWSVNQYNNVQKGKGCQGGRKRLNIT